LISVRKRRLVMKTLAGWIVGVFGLGLLIGGFYANTAAVEADRGSLESTLQSAPLVDCGAGRQTVLEPVLVDGKTTVRFKCVANATERVVETRTVAATAPVAAVDETAPIREKPVDETAEKDSRSLKDSALIIGGSAGAGAGIGALAKGKKGAAVGAAIGGVAGTVYDLVTRNKKR
jgi:hypothetical protein